MADKFYDGMPNVNEKLNEMDRAFAAGPYDALPKTGGNLTGPVMSTSHLIIDEWVSMAYRSALYMQNSGLRQGWWVIGRLNSGLVSSEAQIRISGATGYAGYPSGSNAILTTIMLRVDNDYVVRGRFFNVGGTSADGISSVRVGADGAVYVYAPSFASLAIYVDSNKWEPQELRFVDLPADTHDIPAEFSLKMGAASALNIDASNMVVNCEFIGKRILPAVDNVYDIGQAAVAYRTIYARTGTISTSDARLKRDFRDLTAAEIAAARDLARAIGVYRWRDAVDCKGDGAREHIGPTVQRAIEIMQAHGLEPFNYGFICHDEWEQEAIEHPAIEARYAVPATEAASEVLDSLGNVVTPATPANPGFPAVEARAAYTEVTQQAGDRYAFRYDELAMFIAAGQEARLAALEAA